MITSELISIIPDILAQYIVVKGLSPEITLISNPLFLKVYIT